MTRLFPGSGVRAATIDGVTVILDLRTNSYLLLDKTATAMFEVLTTEPDHTARVKQLTARLGGGASVIETDLLGFMMDCLKRGLLSPDFAPLMERPSTSAPSRPSALALRAWWSLVTTWQLLKNRSLASAYEAFTRLPKPAPTGEPRTVLLGRAEKAFLFAENLFPLRRAPRDCLPRSLALFSFLNNIGIACIHNIGVIRTPFTAHAWVEVGGVPVLEPRHEPGFNTLARI